MADTSTQSIVISAPPDSVAAVICDFPRYPEWASATRTVQVIEEYEDGYASKVRFVLDAGIVSDEYVLAYEYAEDSSYDIADNGDGSSTVTYTLSVELAIAMLGMFKRKAEKAIMDTALTALKKRVETLAAA